MLADKFILSLDSVELQDKHLLPSYPSIYYVVDNKRIIWYIGRSINLQKRWNSESPHHRYHQLLSISDTENLNFFIYYSQGKKKKLAVLENTQIAKDQPRLNYTPVMVKGFVARSVVSRHINYKHTNNITNASLKILSSIGDRKYIHINKETNEMEAVSKKIKNSNDNLKRFKRKFIALKSEDIGLNFEIEICIDNKQRLFVRHYTYFAFYQNQVNVADLNKNDVSESYLSTLESRCSYLYNHSSRWLGYKLKCETVLLVDEEEKFEIETTEIMLPFRMFVELVEYDWMTKNNMSEILEKKKLGEFKNERLSIKVAKYLHDNNLTLYKLLEQIDTD